MPLLMKPVRKKGKDQQVFIETESFTAAFSTDAHAAADYFLKHRTDNSEEISREETDAGDEGRRVTLTYKLGMP